MGGGGEFFVSGFRFFSNFDSGNLGRVEIVQKQRDDDFNSVVGGIPPLPGVSSGAGSDSALGSLQPPSLPPVTSTTTFARPSTSSTLQYRSAGIEVPEVEFQIWTKPDCHETEFENGNRTWFFFGVEGGAPGTVLRFTVMNLNKQAKLFGQGMAPVYLPSGKSQWERIRDPPSYETVDSQFQMSFKFRLPDDNCQGAVTYFAFTYPYLYKELQLNLDKLQRRYANGHRSYDELSTLPETTIFFQRETVIRSLEQRKMDLITITAMNGLTRDKEANLEHLFKEEQPAVKTGSTPAVVGGGRPYKFRGKKTVFVSARVHPGETCSSFVINGFLKFLLRENDPRSAALRRKYVFKLVPMLNPDGVVDGHYRTDPRGVNLNRVYGNPSLKLNPTIFAARKLILYAHLGKDVNDLVTSPSSSRRPSDVNPVKHPPVNQRTTEADVNDLLLASSGSDNACNTIVNDSDKDDSFVWEAPQRPRRSRQRTSSTSSASRNFSSFPNLSPFKNEFNSQWYDANDNSRFSEGDESIADFSIPGIPSTSRQIFAPMTPTAASVSAHATDAGLLFGAAAGNFIGCSSQQDLTNNRPRTSFLGAFMGSTTDCDVGVGSSKDSMLMGMPSMTGPEDVDAMKKNNKTKLGSSSSANPSNDDDDAKPDMGPTFPVKQGESGLFMYIDIHGHASKRGMFMYGNYFDDPETRIDALLFPKLMSINSANFDFPACNFSQRNMYSKDRNTGAGREGSGRVSVYKATGLTYCYTLECNFNTGRFTNFLPMASRDLGRASPPPIFDVPPKYNPTIFEDTGKSLAISILDLTESNPWTRMTCSSCKNLKGVRSWIRTYIKNSDAEAAAKLSTKSAVKASPIRNRLRNLTTIKKSAIKQLKLSATKSPKSPETPRSLSKIPRKNFTAKNSQCTPGKLVRQISTGSSSDAGGLPPSSKRNRPSSAKLKKLKRPGSKTTASLAGIGGRTKSLSSKSTSNSRSSSPRRQLHTIAVAVASGGVDEKLVSGKSSATKGSAKRGSAKSRGVQSCASTPSLMSSGSVSRVTPATPRLKKLKKKKKKSLVS